VRRRRTLRGEWCAQRWAWVPAKRGTDPLYVRLMGSSFGVGVAGR